MPSPTPRLLIVSAHYPPNPVGGAEIVAHRQAKRLEADGWRTEVFAGRYDPSESERDESALERENYDGLRIHRTPLSSIQLGGNFRSRRHAAQFAQVLSEFRPDVAHFHNITGLGVNLVGVARRAGVRTVVTLHDYWGFCLKNVLLRNDLTLCADHDACHECVARVATPDGLLPVRLRRDYVMRELGQADAFVAPSKALAENYARAGLDLARIATFSAGIDLQSFPPRRRAAPECVSFLCCAHLGEHKGLLVLLDALHELWAQQALRGRWRLTIAGHGHLEAKLRERLAAEEFGAAVTLPGHIAREELRREIGSADVVLLPSIWPENEPVSLLEGLASGAALLASAIGGNLDIVEHGVNGLTYPARDAHALADAMRKLIEEAGLLQTFSEANLARREAYDDALAARRIDALYKAPAPTQEAAEITVSCGLSPPGNAATRALQSAPQSFAGGRLRFIWAGWLDDAEAPPQAGWIWSERWRLIFRRAHIKGVARPYRGKRLDLARLGLIRPATPVDGNGAGSKR